MDTVTPGKKYWLLCEAIDEDRIVPAASMADWMKDAPDIVEDAVFVEFQVVKEMRDV